MNIILRFYFSAFMITLSLTVFAQEFSITGKIFDQQSNAIELANVVLLKGDQFFAGTSTDGDGFFKLINLSEATYTLKISYIGFEAFEQQLVLTGALDLKTIQLKEIPESLNEVVVVAKKPTITRKPDRLIFNVENTALVEGSTLGVLKSTPGVIVTEGSINIKSAPAAVYINNRKVQLTAEELMQLLESSPANSIKSVEVITNPPASYDADSGSVINIIMSKNLVTGYRGSVFKNYTQGVFPRYNAGTSHYFKNNKINLNVNYSYTNQKINRDQDDSIDFLNNLGTINEVWESTTNRNTWSETHNLNLNFDYYFNDRNTLSLSSTGLYLPYFKYQIRNITNIFDSNGNFDSSFTADNLSRDNKYNIGTDLIFKHDFKNEASLTLNGHFTIYDFERDQNVFQDEDIDTEDSRFNTLANQDTKIITGTVDYNLPIEEGSTFEAGTKISNVNTNSNITRVNIINEQEVLDAENTDAFQYRESILAAYANYTKSWDNWDLSIGIRGEQTNIEGTSLTLNETNSQDYLNWFPNASVLYNTSDNISIYASYKRSITRPSYTDLNPFTFFLNENTQVLGNPNLVPSYRDHYKFGVSFLKYFTIEAYYMNYDGDIVELPRQDNETNIIAYTPTNLDKKVDYGFDFAFDYYLTNNWSLYVVTSFYNISESSNFGEGFVQQQQWSNYSILQNNLSLLKDKSLNIGLAIYWIGKNLQQFQTIEDRLITELSVSKSVFNNKGIISLAVEDFFNLHDYKSSLRYLDQSSRNFTDLDNRFVRLGFRYKFGNTKLNKNERSTSEEGRDRIKDLD
ncbi:outer membrane beta-barrel family protein [uncultured Winogradskyella sp.]|uniref:TonB-dependent receptor domain-containing protein n=1 Tax=uncultured Winogradskyella sp. TaxID=395353 RepID=UPI0026201298|nr:outer membrane beta-barrel family protein [uncultured Winogradskyella sp.]